MNYEQTFGIGDYIEFSSPTKDIKGRYLIVNIGPGKVDMYSFSGGITMYCKIGVLEYCKILTSVSCTWG